MSALVFERPKRQQHTHCQVKGCGSPGNYRVMMAGWSAGLVCGHHRNVWQRTWNSGLDVEKAA